MTDRATLLANDAKMLRAQKRRTNAARRFPGNTCPASRHVHMIADSLLSKRRRDPIEDIWEPDHMALSLYSVLESLWKARTEIDELKAAALRALAQEAPSDDQ